MTSTRRGFLAGFSAITAATIASDGPGPSRALAADRRSSRTDPSRPILIKGATILSLDAATGDLERGDILIEGSVIRKIATEIAVSGAEVIDAAGKIAIPGFVDTHRHAWEGQLRRVNPNSADLKNYLEGTHLSFATKYRPEDMYVGNMLTALGCIDAGITTIIDNSHNSRSIDHARAAVEALRAAGIRAVHAPGAPLAGTWQKDSWYDDLAKLQKEKFGDTEDLVTLAMMTAPDAEQWAVGRKLGLDLVTEFFGKEMSDMLPAFRKAGVLGKDNVFNHCTGLSPEAWSLITESGVRVNVCPRSDAHWALEAGFFGYQDALDNGLRPGFSVDNESAYGGDMFTEMRTAFYLQRSAAQGRKLRGDQNAPKPVGMRDVLRAATIDGARVAGLEHKTGSLAEGKQADIVIINANDINLYPSANALGTVAAAADRGNVETVIIGGIVRKRDGKLVGVDMPKLRRATESSRSYLFGAVGFRDDLFAEEFALEH
ncbi:amidohydrolase family protein [Rhizobium glycinendophyticum]|uniref:Amidohydrolase family protein n=1 Tax=Rhizobium glycinendophyticum TaxID=2589807 RepID=A0A504UHY2_9HYPH|nr:amidohydrolase family protein [Rhizobium glycinendophyticum]TPP05032.1 amidohydrolase family protein [Rhizobium glycinendophyticum]